MTTESKSARGLLVAIVFGIVLGGTLGALGGRSMWLALGLAEKDAEVMATAARQKAEFAQGRDQESARFEQAAVEAEDAGKTAEAAKLRQRAETSRRLAQELREDIPKIEERRRLFQKLHDQEAPNVGASWGLLARLCRFAGDMFLRSLFMLVIPLVVTAMVVGVASLGDIRHLGRTGGRTVVFYMTTTGISVLIGIVLVVSIRPGETADDTYAVVTKSALEKEDTSPLDTVLDVFRGTKDASGKHKDGGGMIPRNLFRAATEMNVLGIIFFALIFAAILSTLGERGKPVLHLFEALNEIVMKMVHLVMYVAPVGIFGLVVDKIVSTGGGERFLEELQRLGWYALTVLLGLLLHAVIVLPVLLWIFARRNPATYALGMARALLTALSTASSSATLPITMECAEQNNKVSEKACSFVLPLGATINMDGTALYEAVAVIFIAQSLGIELGLGHLIVIFVTATLAAIGAAGIPEAGLVTMVIVLAAVGLDTQGIGTILAIDWFLDRCRTTVNVWGDSVGAAIIDRFEQQEAGAAAA